MQLKLGILSVATLLAVPPALQAQTASYPNRPLRLLVGFTAGSTTDTIGRLVAQRLGEGLGQQVVVDNRPGAGGNIAAEICAKAAPDGYTAYIANTGISIHVSAYAKLGYNVTRDLMPVGQVAASPHILIVHNALPVKTLKDLIAVAKAKPGQLNFASTGAGNSDHFAAELFKSMTGTEMVHVPYKGGPQASADVASGAIAAYFGGMPVGLPLARAGKVRAIAVTSAQRNPSAPEIPTVAESGIPGYEHVLWNVIVVPIATPKSIVARLDAELQRVARSPELAEKFAVFGAVPYSRSSEEMQAYLRSEIDKYGKIVRAINLRID
jgi:tripartite-type tricarboxylate transporter receptor subunit TctC